MKKNILKLSKNTHWDFDKKLLMSDGNQVILSSSQTKVFDLLANRIGTNVDQVELFSFVWDDDDKDFNERYIRNLISSLRKKVPDATIKNVYGGLYILQNQCCKDKNLLKNGEFDENDEHEFSEYMYDVIEQNPAKTVLIKPVDDRFIIVFANQAYKNFVKAELESVVEGVDFCTIFDVNARRNTIDIIKTSLHAKKHVSTIIGLLRFDGGTSYVKCMLNPIFDRKTYELKYFVVAFKDVSVVADAITTLTGFLNHSLEHNK